MPQCGTCATMWHMPHNVANIPQCGTYATMWHLKAPDKDFAKKLKKKNPPPCLQALLACGASCGVPPVPWSSLEKSISGPFRKSGFSVRKPLPLAAQTISKILKCAPVQAGTLPRGPKVSKTHAIPSTPPKVSPPPLGAPKNHFFQGILKSGIG